METYNSIEVTKQLVKDGKISQEIAETIFPELKESEDERIRKEIITFLDFYHTGNGGHIDFNPAWIAWLEKQGEQNLANSEKTCKVEPKFKVGDWVINTITNEVEQIIDITDSEYICSGHLIVSFGEQHLLKRWTIEDAKDGDVLSFNDGHGNDSIELIKSITEKKIEFWFCLTNGNRYEVFDGIVPYTNLVSREDATPATIEQCDQLEKAMADAGYRWNPDEKKMEKVEQNPAWSEKNEAILDALIRRFEGEDILVSPHLAVECLKTLKERYTWKPSDEQMSQLELVVQHDNFADQYQKEKIVTLFNDLKKLKE